MKLGSISLETEIGKFRSLLRDLKTMGDEITLKVEKEGIKVSQMDPSHISMLCVDIPATWFKSYKCIRAGIIVIDVKTMLATCEKKPAKEILKMEIPIEGETKIVVSNELKREYILPSDTIGDTLHKIPTFKKNVLSGKINLPLRSLYMISWDVKEIAKDIIFMIDPKHEYVCMGMDIEKDEDYKKSIDEGKAVYKVKRSMKTEGKGTSRFAVGYLWFALKPYARECKSDATLHIGTDVPLKLEFEKKGALHIYWHHALREDSMKFVDENGKEYKIVYVKGYHVGDRLLEGVIFKIKVDELKVQVCEESKEYFHQLNEKMWLAAVRHFCTEGEDIYGDQKCTIEVWPEDYEKKAPKKVVKGEVVKMSSIEDILGLNEKEG